jgi:subtilisin
LYYSIIPIAAMIVLAGVVQMPSQESVIVSFKEGHYDPAAVTKVGGSVVEEFKGVGMLHAMVSRHAVSELEQNNVVEFVEYDRQFEIAQDTTVEYSESWGLADIGAEPAHLSSYTGKGVKIAVLDTGMDYNHPELAGAYKGGYDFINNDDDPMDDNGHGSHVAGIIAAAKDGQGMVGVAPDAELYAIKVSDGKGKGSFSGLAKGINWAIENDMDVVTMSITGDGGSRALLKAIDEAYAKHEIVLVAAVGNGGSGSVLFPAAYENVIGVGAVTKENEKSPFSRTGSEVEMVAPGSGIRSTWTGGQYKVMSGTSMATPFVTGAIALLLGSDEQAWAETGHVDGDGAWTADEIRAVLHSTATDLGDDGKDDQFGYGLLNLHFPGSAANTAATPDEEESPEETLERLKMSIRIFIQRR